MIDAVNNYTVILIIIIIITCTSKHSFGAQELSQVHFTLSILRCFFSFFFFPSCLRETLEEEEALAEFLFFEAPTTPRGPPLASERVR